MSADQNAIVLRNVRFEWDRGTPVLDVADFSVAAGESVFIEGPSGSGKSTLLSLITGVAVPTAGSVSVFGEDLGAMGPAARDSFRAERIGVIFQLFNLLPYLSVVENVLLPCDFSPARALKAGGGASTRRDVARSLLDRLGIAKADQNRPANALSVGQQQRVAAARALIGQPELIIADEPTSALDARNRDAFIDTLLTEASASNATVLFVSHDPALGHHFDRRVSLADINTAAKVTA